MAKRKQTQLPLLLLSLLLLLMAVNSAKAVPTLQACGPGLNEALFAFCKGEFAGVIARKRASREYEYLRCNCISAIVSSVLCTFTVAVTATIFGLRIRKLTFPYFRIAVDIFDYVEQQNGLDIVAETDVTPWQHELRSILATRRLNRGIVDECCFKPCKYEEIKAYCLN